MADRKRHVILGSGPAGMAAIETIREIDGGASQITLVSAEEPYARMVLPYWVAGEIPEAQVAIGDAASLERLGVTGVFGKRAAALEPTERRLILDDGTTLPYDELLIATGSRAVKPPIEGLERPGVTCLWTREDARTAIERLGDDAKGKKASLLGAGFIGFIILNALHKLGLELTVIEREDQVLPRMLDAQGAAIVEQWLTDRGVTIHTGMSLAKVGDGPDGRVAADDLVEADLLVVATGIAANTEWLKSSGIELSADGGILVDARLRSSVPGVSAAGDCACGPDVLGFQRAVHPIQPTAVEHGRLAGTNMAGRDAVYHGSLLTNVLDVCGLHCVSTGLWRGEGDLETVAVADAARSSYRKLVFDGDRLVGTILTGRADDTTMLNDVGMAKGLIETRAALGKWKDHLAAQPHDLRRVYLASGVGAVLARRRSTGAPARARGFRHGGLTPAPAAANRGAGHDAIVSTRPSPYEGATPVVGLGKGKSG